MKLRHFDETCNAEVSFIVDLFTPLACICRVAGARFVVNYALAINRLSDARDGVNFNLQLYFKT